MKDEHIDALKQAVHTLNATMREITDHYGGSVSIRPWANYGADSGVAEIEVEITTGRIRINAQP